MSAPRTGLLNLTMTGPVGHAPPHCQPQRASASRNNTDFEISTATVQLCRSLGTLRPGRVARLRQLDGLVGDQRPASTAAEFLRLEARRSDLREVPCKLSPAQPPAAGCGEACHGGSGMFRPWWVRSAGISTFKWSR